MAGKAELDILDIVAEEKPAGMESSAPPEIEPVSPRRPFRIWLHKKVIIAFAVVSIVCFITGGGLFFWIRTGKNTIVSIPDTRHPAATTGLTGHNVAYLDNFVIDYREQGGMVRIAVFALAVELNEPVKKAAVENNLELRGDIHMLSKKRPLGSLLSPEERRTLRTEIATELDKKFGSGAVKAVYFTTFHVL